MIVAPTMTRPSPNPVHVVQRVPGRSEKDPVGHARRRRILQLTLAVGTPVLIFTVWEVFARTGLLDTRFFPAPSTIWSAGVESLRDGVMVQAVIDTTEKMVLGYVIGVIGGVLVGLLLGMSWIARSALDTTMVALYTLPKLALYPVFLLIFGLGSLPQIVLVAVSVFFIVAMSTTAAVVGIEQGYLDAADVFGASRLQRTRHVVIPGSMPAIGTALRLCAGIAILVVVGIEMIGGGTGLGYLIFQRSQVFDPATMYAGVIIAGLLGVLFTTIVTGLTRLALPHLRARRR
ncbi:ABC transporter permease [Prescottella sp. R16]|uniref:ABC transporter permease n=1 Tax=Prescottella sp. R16 TaxID=3064529 RepID=UPI00272E9B6D|nr:ABC transporter permease [Prescottella sp. R16]